jgi:hypothetical protein
MRIPNLRPVVRLMLAACAVGLGTASGQREATAGTFELSAGLSWSQSNYSNDNYQWNRRWGFSVGYYFFALSELELSFQDVYDRTRIVGYQDTTFHDRIYSVNWVQSLAPKTFPVQPYFKVGIGQLNRDASGTYESSGAAPPARLDSITAVLAVGVRIYIIRTFAIKGEGTTYLTGGKISSWQDNFAISTGLSLYL